MGIIVIYPKWTNGASESLVTAPRVTLEKGGVPYQGLRLKLQSQGWDVKEQKEMRHFRARVTLGSAALWSRQLSLQNDALFVPFV